MELFSDCLAPIIANDCFCLWYEHSLITFLWEGYEIVPNGITMTTDAHGRTAGDAYVQFIAQSVAERALEDKHMKRIGHRLVGG